MKRKKLPLLGAALSLLMAAIVIASCESNEDNTVVPQNVNSNEVFTVNGILGFTSSKAFAKYIDENPLANPNIRVQFEKKFNYISMQSSYEKVLHVDAEKQLEYAQKRGFASFESGILELGFGSSISSIVNDQGLVLIGSQLHRFLKNEVRSISLANGLTLSEAISALKKEGAATSGVKISPIKFSKLGTASGNSGQNNRVGVGANNVASAVTNIQTIDGYYNSLRTYGDWGMSSIPYTDQFCESGIVYDPDCLCYVCAGPIVETTYWVNQVSCKVTGTNNWFENYGCVWCASGSGNNGLYVRIDGNITVFFNGTTTFVPLNHQANVASHTFFPFSVTTYSSGNTLEAEGSVTFSTRHSLHGSYPNPVITSVSLSL